MNDRRQNIDGIRPIHSHIAGMVSCAALVTGVAVFFFTGLPFGFVKEGRLAYISEGFEEYCGWAGAILGSTGGITMLGQIVVGVHIGSSVAIAATLLQFVTWNVILGVCNTGWELHYCALTTFFAAAMVFHRIASVTPPYAAVLYQQLNGITILLLPFFAVLFCSAAVVRGHNAEIITATVTLEYMLALLSVAQMLCLSHGLARFCTITLVFEGCSESSGFAWG